MSYSLSDQQASNFNPEMYANQIFNSTSRPIRRPMYLPSPMAKGNFIGGLQMLGDAFGGLKDTLSNRKLKKRLFEESLPEYYKYTVEKDPNDPNDYVLDTKDLYDAMMGEGTLRTPDTYERDLQKYSMVNFDPESGQYNTMYSSRPIDQSLYPGYSDIFGEGSKSLGQFLEDMQGNPELTDLIIQAEGAPEGFFPFMQPDGTMGVTEDPEYMRYYYDTMMGNYEMGGSLPEAQVGMSLFDPNALDAGIGVTGGGAGVRSNSNPSNITAETLATDVTSEGSIFSKAAENLRDFFKILRIPRYYSAYEYGGSLPKAQWSWNDFTSGISDAWDDATDYISDTYDDAQDAFIESDVNKYLSNKLEEATGYDDIGNLVSTYANPYNYTRGAGYDDPVSAIGGYLMGDENAISGPADYSRTASNKDDAFAQARKDLGPGQYFTYDGVRYKTDYYGQTEDKNTNEVLSMLKEGIGDYYDQATYDRFIDLWNQVGQPDFNLGADYDPGFAAGFSPSFQEVTDAASSIAGQRSRIAAHVNPMTSPNTGGNIFITDGSDGSVDYTETPLSLMDILIEEMAHSKQLRDMGRFNFVKDYLGDLFHAHGDQGSTYDTEGTIEHDAHKVMALPFYKYVYEGRKLGGSLDDSLPKAQYNTPGVYTDAGVPEWKPVLIDKEASDRNAAKYNIKVIQYPYGYEGMEPGHIEAALVDDEGNYVSASDETYADILKGRDPYINRWNDIGNRRVTYMGDDPNVRTATMELSRAELENFLDQASTFSPTDNSLFGLPTAFGFQTTDGAYDFVTSNCADGICLGLGNPDGPDIYDAERKQLLTNPLAVMDLVLQDPRTVSSSGNRVTLLEGASDLMNREMGGLVEYQNFGQVNRPTFREWFIQNQVRASAMTQEEAEQAYDFETLDPVDYMAKYDPAEITEPDITISDDVTIASPTVTGEKAKFQRFLDSPGMDLFKGIGTFGVQSATALNEMFGLDRVAREAEEDRMRMTSADNAFMTSNPLFDQGIYDVNTGLTPGGYAKGFGMARLGMEVDADPEIIEALVKAGANVNYI